MDFSERELEDWVEENIHEVLGVDEAVCPVIHVDRQVTLATGRVADIIATYRGPFGEDEEEEIQVFHLLELKATTVDGRALAQILDYLAGLHSGLIEYRRRFDEAGAPRLKNTLRGLLVGPDITAEVLRALWASPVDFRRVSPTFKPVMYLAKQYQPEHPGEDFIDVFEEATRELESAIEDDRELSEHFRTLAEQADAEAGASDG